MRSIKHISIIGSGNVATHLGKALSAAGLEIDCVFSRKMSRAKKLANQLSARACSKLTKVDTSSDLYIIAISDDAIPQVANNMIDRVSPNSLIVHTSGSVSSEVIKTEKSGIFYPLQSFSIDRDIVMSTVPFCIHSKDPKVEKLLMALARKLSKRVYRIDDQERSILHLAAVFSSNFSNHMYHLAASICEEHKVDFDILKPLITETAAKIENASPYAMQTGPARRNDQQTIKSHLSKLKASKNSKEIYKLISKNISAQYDKK